MENNTEEGDHGCCQKYALRILIVKNVTWELSRGDSYCRWLQTLIFQSSTKSPMINAASSEFQYCREFDTHSGRWQIWSQVKI